MFIDSFDYGKRSTFFVSPPNGRITFETGERNFFPTRGSAYFRANELK